MNSTEKKPKRFPKVSKKTFIFLILAVCGVALIAEAILLIHAFSKNGKDDSEKAGKNTPDAKVEEKKTTWMIARYTEFRDGVKHKEETFSYDEEGRLVRLEYIEPGEAKDQWETNLVSDVTYEKSGIKVSYHGRGMTETYFLRSIEEEWNGEREFRIRQAEYDLEYDEQGYWKRITYEQDDDDDIITVHGRDYEFNADGRMAKYRDWEHTKLDVAEEITLDTVTFEYDGQGRVVRYVVETAPMRSYPAPGEYRIEYGEDRQKESRYVNGVLAEEIEWIYEETGTWRNRRSYTGNREQIAKEYTFKMPDSYGYAEPANISFGMYYPSDEYPYSFERDAKGRLVSVWYRDEGGEPQLKYSAEYDEMGRVSVLRDHFQDLTAIITYDENGNVVKIAEQEATDDGIEKGIVSEFEYIEINLPNS